MFQFIFLFLFAIFVDGFDLIYLLGYKKYYHLTLIRFPILSMLTV